MLGGSPHLQHTQAASAQWLSSTCLRISGPWLKTRPHFDAVVAGKLRLGRVPAWGQSHSGLPGRLEGHVGGLWLPQLGREPAEWSHSTWPASSLEFEVVEGSGISAGGWAGGVWVQRGPAS